MNAIYHCLAVAALFASPVTATLAQHLNPGNSGGGHSPIATPTYGANAAADPALTAGSRFSVTPTTPADQNPAVPGATGLTIVNGNNSTISGNRQATIKQKTGGTASDSPG